MFSSVRWRLTVLYAGITLLFISAFGVGCYLLLDKYLQGTTDLALQHKMAHEFMERNLPVPQELADADQYWITSRTRLLPQPVQATPGAPPIKRMDDHSVESEEAFEGELASIFIIPLDPHGTVTITPTNTTFPIVPNQAAITRALARERDWRTITVANGTRVRVLTYRLPAGGDTAVIQAGRTLSDQDRLLRRLLEVLIVLGAASAVLIGCGGWWLAGRSLQPAQEAWARQQAFIANASHELRTPLTLLRASSDVAQRYLPADATDSRALLDDVLHECDYMGHLMEDLLLLSRLDTKRLPVTPHLIQLNGVFEAIQRQFGLVAAERAIHLTVETAPITVYADETRLHQVLLILLDNALHYTPTGGAITLTTEAHAHFIQIRVADTGCGIAPEHMPHIFERFYRADPAHVSETGGSGLGLAIAKALVTALRGRIWIESVEHGGTNVFFTLPRDSSAPMVERKAFRLRQSRRTFKDI